MPPSSCPASQKKPSFLLALVCAAIVAAYDPRWLARPVSALRGAAGARPERISRLKARLLVAFEHLLLEATRRGRPPSQGPPADAAVGAVALELLPVATELLRESRVPWRKRAVQDRLVALARPHPPPAHSPPRPRHPDHVATATSAASPSRSLPPIPSSALIPPTCMSSAPTSSWSLLRISAPVSSVSGTPSPSTNAKLQTSSCA